MRTVLDFLAKIARLDALGWLVRNGYLPPSVARGVEILILGAVATAACAGIEYALNGGTGVNSTLTVAVTAGLAFITKALRAKAVQASAELAAIASKASEELSK